MAESFFLPVFYAFAASFCFGILFNIRGGRLWAAAACGALSWTVYLMSGQWLSSVIARNLVAMVAVSVCAEVMARLFKTPVSTFLVLGLIPLVPGAGMYDTMERMLSGDLSGAVSVGLTTLGVAAALGFGIVMVSSFSRIVTAALRKKRVDKRQEV